MTLVLVALLAGALHSAHGGQASPELVDWTAAGTSWWADTVARLAGTRCAHMADPATVVIGEAWGVGLRCSACPIPEPDDTAPSCDRCGRTPLEDDGTWGGFVQRGRVVLAVILCLPCFHVIGGHAGEGPS